MSFARPLVYLMVIAFCLVIASMASAYEVPKDAVIKVYTKDGKQIGEMSRSEYKVVKLNTSKDFTKEEVSQLITSHVKSQNLKPEKKNRLTVKAGTGFYDMRRSYQGNTHTIEQRRDFLMGVSYSRKLTDEFSLGGTIHTNETMTLDAGVDF